MHVLSGLKVPGGCLPGSHTNVALVELYQSSCICLLTAAGLRPLCSKSVPILLIESPSLPQLPFDSDQAQQPISRFLTLLILRSRKRWHLLNLYTLRLKPAGWTQQTGASRLQRKKPIETEIVIS